jgi:hypothetical protein
MTRPSQQDFDPPETSGRQAAEFAERRSTTPNDVKREIAASDRQ